MTIEHMIHRLVNDLTSHGRTPTIVILGKREWDRLQAEFSGMLVGVQIPPVGMRTVKIRSHNAEVEVIRTNQENFFAIGY